MIQLFILICLFFSPFAFSDTQQDFQRLKQNPKQLQRFVATMPKGGDLHLHLAGGVSAFVMLDLAKTGRYQFCDFATICRQGTPAQDYLSQHWQTVIDAWSMPAKLIHENGHDHFFATFLKFWPIVFDNRGAILAQMRKDAARQQVQYVELMISADNNRAGVYAHNLPWTGEFNHYRTALLKKGLAHLIEGLPHYIDYIEAEANQIIGCKTHHHPACDVHVRYQSIVLREQAPGTVFAEMLLSFELAKRDPRVVAVNLVQAEDGHIALRDYHLHMRMLNYFHHLYPDIPISLHAGELRPQYTKRKDLRFHITEAIRLGHALRIGHGVTLPYEKNLGRLLAEIKSHQILFEINLSSNEKVLGVKPKDHPFPWLMKHGIPVALSTDDPGILVTDLNREYELAVKHYNLDYHILKWLNRNSLQYSFIPGAPLWDSVKAEHLVKACEKDKFDKPITITCQRFLDKSEKAQLQWQLEQKLLKFEKTKAYLR